MVDTGNRIHNTPFRPSKSLPDTGLKLSGLIILGLDGLGYSKTRLQDRRPYSLLIGSYTEIDV
jgi:hypothetical protein